MKQAVIFLAFGLLTAGCGSGSQMVAGTVDPEATRRISTVTQPTSPARLTNERETTEKPLPPLWQAPPPAPKPTTTVSGYGQYVGTWSGTSWLNGQTGPATMTVASDGQFTLTAGAVRAVGRIASNGWICAFDSVTGASWPLGLGAGISLSGNTITIQQFHWKAADGVTIYDLRFTLTRV